MLSYLFISGGVAVITALILYLDSRLFDRPKKRITYIKVIMMNIAIVLSTIGVLTWLSPVGNIKDVVQTAGKSTKITSGPVVNVPQIGEEMLAGDAPF